jgi:hypothetical protein
MRLEEPVRDPRTVLGSSLPTGGHRAAPWPCPDASFGHADLFDGQPQRAPPRGGRLREGRSLGTSPEAGCRSSNVGLMGLGRVDPPSACQVVEIASPYGRASRALTGDLQRSALQLRQQSAFHGPCAERRARRLTALRDQLVAINRVDPSRCRSRQHLADTNGHIRSAVPYSFWTIARIR